MKTRMKIKADIILLFLVITILLGLANKSLAHESKEAAATELLIVIDNSGSMKENLEFLGKIVNLIKLLADARNANVTISYLQFNETALITDKFDEIQVVSGKETCIMQGIEAADQWMSKKIENGSSVKVLFISDLFSSRYLEKESGKLKVYDMDWAEKEQDEISAIEGKWEGWCEAKKANVLIWTWESFCRTEKQENTIDNLKENGTDEISIGYQVKFKPDKNIIIDHSQSEIKEKDIEFIKQTIQSFEILLGSPNASWKNEKYVINPREERNLKVEENEKAIYLFFPTDDNITITYNGANVETKYNGLYILDKKENKYFITGHENADKSEGYLLRVPDLKWELCLPDTPLKKSNDFIVSLIPSESLNGIWGTPENYDCILQIKNNQNSEICYKNMEYDSEKGVFFTKCNIAVSGWYTFICEVNGNEIGTIERKVN